VSAVPLRQGPCLWWVFLQFAGGGFDSPAGQLEAVFEAGIGPRCRLDAQPQGLYNRGDTIRQISDSPVQE